MPGSKAAHRKKANDRRYAVNRFATPVPCHNNFVQCLKDLESMDVEKLKTMIQLAGLPEFTQYQTTLLISAVAKLFGVEARGAQIRVIRRLLYGIGDTILVARTGFGKSLTFQAFCALTDMIAIQLIPLSKLGDQQASRMAMIKGACACLITAETLDTNHRLLEDVRRRKYNHILLGPEQAVSPRFRRILRDPDFAKHVGLIIIDECHVLSSWGVFRESVTHINELRHIIPSRVVMYGCTATLTVEQEHDVRLNGGFRPDNGTLQGLELIRISCDRPELQIIVCPIQKRMATSYAQLYFVLHGAVQNLDAPDEFKFGHVVPAGYKQAEECALSQRVRCSPEKVPKTIIFVDGIKKIETVLTYTQIWLVQLGYNQQDAAQLVCTYSSNTSRYDQDSIIDEFTKKDSRIRIIVATSAVGMGMDIGDVALVVQWDLPIDQEVSDLWQRWGRAAREVGREATVVLFCPWWCFDDMGCLGKRDTTIASSTAHASRGKKGKNRLRESQAASQIQDVYIDDSNSDSGADSGTGNDVASQSQVGPRRKEGAVHVWTASEIKKRENINRDLMAVINGNCHRDPVLRVLQENLCEPDSRQARAVGVRCCSAPGCAPELRQQAENWSTAESATAKVRRPRAKTKSGKVLVSLEEWVHELAVEYSNERRMWCAAPTIAVMSQETCIRIAIALGRAKPAPGGSLPAVIADRAKFHALPAVESWARELTILGRWRLDLRANELVERLRTATIGWPVFNSELARPDALAAGSTEIRSDVAQREAELASQRRELHRREELRVAIQHVANTSTASSRPEPVDHIKALTEQVVDSRTRANNIEFLLAAMRNRQNASTVSSTVLSTPLSSRLDGLSISPRGLSASSQGHGSSASASLELSSSFTLAAGTNQVEARHGDIESRGAATSSSVDTAGNSRPVTPDAAPIRKRYAEMPGSGRRGEKRKVHRNATSVADRDSVGSASDGSVRGTY